MNAPATAAPAIIEKRYTVDKRVYHIIEPGPPQQEFFFPSVTTILDMTEPKNYLLNQFQMEEVEKKGVEGARFALWMAAERGTKIHKAIEDHNLNKPVYWFEEVEIPQYEKKTVVLDGTALEVMLPIAGHTVVRKNYDDFEWRCIAKYMDWKSKYKPVFMNLEMELYSKEYGFAGTTDALAKIGSGLYICDWKSSKDTFEKYKLQVAAYFYAYIEMTGKKPDGALVLSLRYEKNKEGWKCDMMDEKDMEKWFNRFLTRHKLFNEMYPDFEAKRDLLPVAFLPEL